MRRYVLFGIFALIIAGCSMLPAGAPVPDAAPVSPARLEPTPIPIDSVSDSSMLQGHLVPGKFTELSFGIKGQVAEVLVQNGQTVKAGDVIARLTNQESLDANIAAANLDLLIARQNYEDLQSSLPEAQLKALEDLFNAQDDLYVVQARLDSLTSEDTSSVTPVEVAQANVVVAQYELEQAKAQFRWYANSAETSYTRASVLVKLGTVQDKYNIAVATLNTLLDTNSKSEAIARTQNELTIAQARVDEAQAKYDQLLNGPDPADVEIAQARIDASEKALAAAQASLKELELHAPMDGTIVNLNLVPGQYILEGQAASMVVDYSNWYVESDTWEEDQLSYVSPGQAVTVVADELPDLQLGGVVESISSVYQAKQGKTLYTAYIRLDGVDPRLRWGMNAAARLGSPIIQK